MLKKDLLIAKMIDVPHVSVARRITITPGQEVKTEEKLMCFAMSFCLKVHPESVTLNTLKKRKG